MANKESESIKANTPYGLGEYSFNCTFDDSPTLGTYARASMTKDGQTAYKTVSLPNNSRILGYTVEAGEDVATVYAVVKVPENKGASGGLLPEGVVVPITSNLECTLERLANGADYWMSYGFQGVSMAIFRPWEHLTSVGGIHAEAEPFTISHIHLYCRNNNREEIIERREESEQGSNSQSYTYDGKTVYYTSYGVSQQYSYGIQMTPPPAQYYGSNVGYDKIAWTMVYGTPETEEVVEEIIVGRFKIDLKEAGGVGPGSDWVDPGDYDEDWEEGDPTHTLYVAVTGALSGRHNDPIEDPSYSYIPADKDTVKDYGCGGDGGHGGGGGAGASTVVIHKFATNQANSKEVTAIARRHGYGSGGGKGGKGGDGCILVYY